MLSNTNSEQILVKLREQINQVPKLPGVYLWKDKDNKIIYVGKAKQLKSRMRQYVNFQDSRDKIPMLVSQIRSFDYVVVKNEEESLILEKNFIQKHKPYFNVDFKDDKSYPFLALTKGDIFPAIKYTREKHVPTTRYFGPYTDSKAARQMVDIVRKVVPICACSCAEWRKLNRKTKNVKYLKDKSTNKLSNNALSKMQETVYQEKPCFDCHVGLGPGACCGKISPEKYKENVTKVEKFLAGSTNEFIKTLKEEMSEAAKSLDFEKAGRIKARLDTICSLTDKQYIVSKSNLNADVIGFYREETIAGAHVLKVREGRIVNNNEFILDKGKDIPTEELVHTFLLKYYDTTTSIPHKVILEDMPDDIDIIEEWLTKKLNSKYGAKVRLISPKKGEKAQMLNMAQQNAKHSLFRYKIRTNYDDKRINNALLQLESALALPTSPIRIECFDISTIHGSYTVGSMVVFTAGKPDKNQYRRFRIKTPLDEANDFLCMQEVLRRRYNKKRMEDKKFGKVPNLIILDGGKPQLRAAIEIFNELGIDLKKQGIALVGLAKRDEELYVPWDVLHKGKQSSDIVFQPVILPDGSASLYLVKQVRDEAHRFAITFHRQLRQKGMTTSILDEVAGLGPVRKKAILKAFGGFRNLSQASLEDIQAMHVLPEDVAKEVFLVLQQQNS